MKLMQFAVITGILVSMAAAPALAADTKAPTPQKTGIFNRIDTNHDGSISLDEFVAPQKKRFDAVDANHDGKITQEEDEAFRKAAMEQRAQRRAERQKAQMKK